MGGSEVAFFAPHTTYIQELEKTIQIDPGKRGIAEVFPAVKGELEKAASLLATHGPGGTVAIVTGFNLPPQETDGPLGALAVARALHKRGVAVKLVTGNFCVDILRRGVQTSAASYNHGEGDFQVVEFPAGLSDVEAAEWSRQFLVGNSVSAAVSIEVVGPSVHDNRLHRMSGKDCSLENGNLYKFWEALVDQDVPSISIGDGGNELGCGKYLEQFLQSAIPNIAIIACKLPCHALVLSGVSNWGGYALALALALRSCEVLSVEGERAVLQRIVATGAVDPRLGSALAVDGMLFDEKHAELIATLLSIQGE